MLMFILCSYEHHVVEWWFMSHVLIWWTSTRSWAIFHVCYHVECKFKMKYGRDKNVFFPSYFSLSTVSFFFNLFIRGSEAASSHMMVYQYLGSREWSGCKKYPENKNVSAEVWRQCKKREISLSAIFQREISSCDFLVFLPSWIEQWGNVLATCWEWSRCDLRSPSKPRRKMMQ